MEWSFWEVAFLGYLISSRTDSLCYVEEINETVGYVDYNITGLSSLLRVIV